MPVFEIHFENLISNGVRSHNHLVHEQTLNYLAKFSYSGHFEVEQFTVKENLYTNLQLTIISFFVDKNYYHIVISFLCYVFSSAHLPLRIFSFLSYAELSLKTTKKKIKKPEDFSKQFSRMDKCSLFLKNNVLLFDVLTISVLHFVLFFSILSQKNNFYVKGKNNIQSSCMIFFAYFMSDGQIF